MKTRKQICDYLLKLEYQMYERLCAFEKRFGYNSPTTIDMRAKWSIVETICEDLELDTVQYLEDQKAKND